MTEVRRHAEWLAREISEARRAGRGLSLPQLANSSVEGGSVDVFDGEGTLTTVVGEQFDGTHGVGVIAGPPPPAPVAPSVTVQPGFVEVRWSGKFADDAVSPMDFSHVSIHAAREEEFEPDNTSQLATIRGESGDATAVVLEAGPWSVCLVAVSKAGKWSEPSEFVAVDAADFIDMSGILDDFIEVGDALNDLDAKYDGVITEAGQLGSRLDQAVVDLGAAKGRLDQAQADIDSAFVKITDADSKATSALTMAGSKSKVMYSTAAPSGTASTNDVWRRVNAAKDVIGEWYWTGSAWQESKVTSEAISNLDVGKLTAGSANIATVTAQKIAASVGAFIELDVTNLRVTGTGTLNQAVIDKLWTDVVYSRKITANMIAIGAFDNLIEDPAFNVIELWETGSGQIIGGPGSGWDTTKTYGEAARSVKLRQQPSGAANMSLYAPQSNFIPVQPGESFRVTSKVLVNGATPGLLRVAQQVYFFDANSSMLSARGNVEAGRLTSLPVNEWVGVGGIVTAPEGAVYMRPRLTVYYPTGATPNGTSFYLGYSQANRASDGSLVVDGSIVASKIDTDAILAKHVKAREIQAQHLETEMVLTNRVIAGNPNGPHARMSAAGFESYANPDGSGYSAAIKMGSTGDDFLSIVDANNETVGSFSSDGKISGSEITSGGDIYMGGSSLTETLQTKTIGAVAWGGVAINEMTGLTGAGEIGLYELALDTTQDDPARLYRFMMDTFTAEVTGIGTVGLRLRITTDGAAPTINNSAIAAYNFQRSLESGTSYHPFSLSRLVLSTRNQYIRVLVTLVSNGPKVEIFNPGSTQSSSLFATFEDLGPAIAESAVYNRAGGGTTGGNNPPPPPPPPAKVTRVQTWNATATRSFTGSGSFYDFAPGKLFQGQSPAGYGDMRSIAIFPTSIASTLSGATVNWVKVYAYADHWYYNSGGNAKIGTSGYTSLPGSLPSTNLAITSAGWPKPGGRWVTLPASLNNGWRTGANRAITFGGRGGGYAEYGTLRNVRIQISYTK